MADFGGFNIPTPQEVLAGLHNRRQQVMSSGNVQAQRSQNMETALDTIFGNPQLNLAKRMTNAVKQAEQRLTPIEGESDLDRELRRLQAVRDAVADLSPETAGEITGQMLKLGQTRLEQQKLRAEESRAASKEARESQAAPLDIALKQAQIMEKANEGQNYWKAVNGKIERINVSTMDSLERRRLRNEGWTEGSGPNTEAEATDALGLTKPVTTDLQKSLLDADQQLEGLFAISQKYDPTFLQLPTQAMNFGRDLFERAGGTLSAEQAGKLQDYSEFKRNSVDAFNRYIKFITGAAMSNKEADRIQKGFPDPDKDGGTKFMSKLRETVRQTIAVRKRAADALKTGLRVNGDQWDQIALPQVTDSEVDDLMTRMMGVPSGKAPAGADGWTDMGGGVRIRVKQ